MAICLGVDTGGTYTDAVILDDASDLVLGKAKALTTRPDLAGGVGDAIDAALLAANVAADAVDMVALSTTLATNALVEGQGGRVALVFIGFDDAELARGGLKEALRGDPVILLRGGHGHGGSQEAPLDLDRLREGLATLPSGVTGFAIAAKFAVRNPAHELAARDVIATVTGQPVTCSHELSAGLGGPKRALTAVLNARLIGMIARLIDACEAHLARRGITARLMVVRGDGALIPANMARARPIETILSGPAASVAGASWLTNERDALIADIGGTTTDICLLRDGQVQIDPQGAQIGGLRTMVEAVAMHTFGLGGDSAVSVLAGLDGGLTLGPRRVMPIALLAAQYPDLVHGVLDTAFATEGAPLDGGEFVIPLWAGAPPDSLDARETVVAARLGRGPLRMGDATYTRIELAALMRLVTQGLVMIAGVTPSDAAHVLGRADQWDAAAATKALALFARRKAGDGKRIAPDERVLAQMIVDQLTVQTTDCLLQTAFGADSRDWRDQPQALARHPLTTAGLDRHAGLISVSLRLGVPVIGLGASAATYYGAVGDRLHTKMIVPDHADVANAIGAVVGQVSMQANGSVTSPGAGRFIAHLQDGPQAGGNADDAMEIMEAALTVQATAQAAAAGVQDPQLTTVRDVTAADVEGQSVFLSADIRVTARGRPRIAQ